MKAWELYFVATYKRKPKMIEREQYFIGRLDGLRSLRAVQKAITRASRQEVRALSPRGPQQERGVE